MYESLVRLQNLLMEFEAVDLTSNIKLFGYLDSRKLFFSDEKEWSDADSA